jgi:hypothetical protein
LARRLEQARTAEGPKVELQPRVGGLIIIAFVRILA